MITAQKNTRLLAAVMFIDIVGYTALMQKDEERAIQLRNRQRKILEEKIAKHKGIIVQYYGDGALNIFSSAYNAGRCAVEIQQQLQSEAIPVRIGIHMGDIVYNSDGVYGNAVNVAARIESLSTPGGIFISEKVFDEIKNHSEIKTIPIGTFNLKNVDRPVKIYALKNRELKFYAQGTQIDLEKELSKQIRMELVQPFISNVHAGLIN